jgi:hypothetical protein
VELDHINQLMVQAGIMLCPLKGPLLSQSLYGNALQRIACDLDLLIPEAALIAADSILRANGYLRIEPKRALSKKQEEFYPKIVHHFIYQHPVRRINIELHWSIAATYLVPMKITHLMLDRSSVSMLSGFPIRSLMWEDTFAFLVIHASRHNWAHLKWVVDLTMVVKRNPNLDWENVQETMCAIGWQRALIQCMHLMKHLYQIPIPATMEGLMSKEPIALALAKESLAALGRSHPKERRAGRLERGRIIWYWIKLKPGLRHTLLMIGMGLINTDDWFDVSLPDILFPLYIFLRPVLWLRRFHINPHRSR